MIAALPAPPIQAPAAAATTATAVVTSPEWLKRPSPAAIQAALPEAARADGVGGQAGFACEILPDGRLTKCYPDDPTNGYGFSTAAMALAPTFRIQPGTSDGRPIVGQRVYIPIRFEPPPGVPLRVRPLWTNAPTAAEVRAALPVVHGVRHPGGVGVMRCTVAGGPLTDCRPAAGPNDPLGRAALTLAPRFAMADAFTNGRATRSVILDIRIVFDPPKAKTPPPTLDDPPIWLRAPTADEIAATTPTVAKEQGVTQMEADEACIVQPDGGLGACKLTREAPVGVGVAQAAARLVNVYQTVAWMPEGRSTAGAPVKLTLKWEAPPPARAPTPKAAPAKPRR